MNRTENLLIVADSEHDANILYAVGMFVPDPFIFLRIRGRDSVIMSDLEIDRARKEASHCRVLSLGDIQRKLRAAGSKCGFAEVIATVLRQQRVKTISVPSSFPLGLALELQHWLG